MYSTAGQFVSTVMSDAYFAIQLTLLYRSGIAGTGAAEREKELNRVYITLCLRPYIA